MSLEAYNKKQKIPNIRDPRPTGIACPKCGAEMFTTNESYPTSPPRRIIKCSRCGNEEGIR